MTQEARQCGTCNACCKTHAVTELQKPAGRWCQYAKPGKGCSVYGHHPTSCKEFSCGWLRGVGGPNQRPDKVKIVVDPVVYEWGPPKGTVQVYEVSEGALGTEYATKVTQGSLTTGRPVLHISARGRRKLFIPHDVSPEHRRQLIASAEKQKIDIA
jgi:hypothetical protein